MAYYYSSSFDPAQSTLYKNLEFTDLNPNQRRIKEENQKRSQQRRIAKTMTEESNETIIQLYDLNYSDLIALSETSNNTRDLQSVTNAIMENLGPSGPGLLAVTGVPGVSDLRQTLLPLARRLALMNNDERKRVLKDHGLGSDVPLKNIDRTVSAFAMQLKYNGDPDVSSRCNVNHSGVESCGSDDESLEFKNLRNVFKELGNCMIEMGLRLARVCDKVIGGHELEQSLLESCSAKGRLIHYHSILDNIFLQALNDTRSKSKKVKKTSSDQSDLWQQWHYDYGVLTILTEPMFMFDSESDGASLSCDEKECPAPSGHTDLQILYPNKNSVVKVKASSGSFIVQVGESADILSKGKLRATLHSVCRPKNLENVSRETFVVFLQPAWSKTLSLYDFPEESLCANDGHSRNCDEENQCQKTSSDISKLVPPLRDRLKDGMTFAEFSRETTKQYYGSSGLQTKR